MKTRVEWGCPLKLHSRSSILYSPLIRPSPNGEWTRTTVSDCVYVLFLSLEIFQLCADVHRLSTEVSQDPWRPILLEPKYALTRITLFCSTFMQTHIYTHTFSMKICLSHISVQLLAHRSTFNSYTSDAYLMHHTFRHCRQPNVKSPFLIKEIHWCFSVSHFHVKMFSIIYRKSVYALFFFVTWGWFWPPVGSSSYWIVYATYTWTTNCDTIALRFPSVFNCMCQMEMKWLISDNKLTHRGPCTYFLKI